MIFGTWHNREALFKAELKEDLPMPTSPFHRTNLNLYASDVAYMQHVYGRGWTEQARDIIHQELKAIKSRLEPFDELQFPGGEIVRLHKDGTISHGK